MKYKQFWGQIIYIACILTWVPKLHFSNNKSEKLILRASKARIVIVPACKVVRWSFWWLKLSKGFILRIYTACACILET